jgi:hypothetical protein
MGKIVSDPARRAIHEPLRRRVINGFHVVDLPPDTPPVSLEDIKRIDSESE